MGKPLRGPVPTLMRAAKDAGYNVVRIDLGGGHLYFNLVGLEILSDEAGLSTAPDTHAGKQRQIFLIRRIPNPGDPAPCARLTAYGDPYSLYLARRPLKGPPSTWRLWCPLRASQR